MKNISFALSIAVIFSIFCLMMGAPPVCAGGADEEHFRLQQAGGAGQVIQSNPQLPTMPPAPVGAPGEPSPKPAEPAELEPAEEEATGESGRPGWYQDETAEPPQIDQQEDAFQKRFVWWPTDAKPAPVKDMERGGYWWWPTEPGQMRPWGNRGHIFVRKIIFDYKEVPTTSPEQMKPSLIVKKILKNVKIYFDFDKSEIREDAIPVLNDAVRILNKNPETDILITGHADTRGTEKYNLKLAERRAESMRQFMLSQGIPDTRIRIVSRGKLDAVAPVTDLVGMQKDRNAQFMVAEVVEIMLPESQRHLYEPVGEPEVEEIESEVRVSFEDYTIQKGDTLGELAEKVYGSATKWEYIYNFNRDRIKNPHKLKEGQVIRLPKE